MISLDYRFIWRWIQSARKFLVVDGISSLLLLSRHLMSGQKSDTSFARKNSTTVEKKPKYWRMPTNSDTKNIYKMEKLLVLRYELTETLLEFSLERNFEILQFQANFLIISCQARKLVLQSNNLQNFNLWLYPGHGLSKVWVRKEIISSKIEVHYFHFCEVLLNFQNFYHETRISRKSI